MGKFLLIMVVVFALLGCSSDGKDNKIDKVNSDDLFGTWVYVRIASDAKFKSCIEDDSDEDVRRLRRCDFRLNNNFYCPTAVGVDPIEAQYEIDGDVLVIVKGEFAVWHEGPSIQGRIQIIEYTDNNKLILKWYCDEKWWIKEGRPAGYYYTELRRLSSLVEK